MDKDARDVLQVTKEIIIKFIELHRVSPANFGEIFPQVHRVVRKTVASSSEAEKDREGC
ncbi:MAG: hypothetical protein LBP61_08925 [Desulfovibrio sp.]|jgi:predicted transcriptional regulator|nr:hypothetical protein [Desulfovibrio sp.]